MIALLSCLLAMAAFVVGKLSGPQPIAAASTVELKSAPPRPRPVLGAHFNFADGPNEVIFEMVQANKQDILAQALRSAGIEDLRMSFHGYYSHLGPEATARLKRETKLTNIFPWFPIESYIAFIKKYRFKTVLGINVEEGADVAEDLIKRFEKAGALDLITSVEFGNEPFLSPRPWPPEEYAAKCAEIIKRLRPYKVKMGVALIVGKNPDLPTRMSGDEYCERTLATFAKLIDLKNSNDLFGIIHLYKQGVSPEAIEQFNSIVRKYSPMKYQVTEYNIRLFFYKKNPHLTNDYALELARKLNRLMVEPDVVGLWIHSFPYHALSYWSDGKKATVAGFYDSKLKDLTPGWHLTPAGEVHHFYHRWAWNGEILAFVEQDDAQYWAVRSPEMGTLVSILNEREKPLEQEIRINGASVRINVGARSLTCYSLKDGKPVAALNLAGN